MKLCLMLLLFLSYNLLDAQVTQPKKIGIVAGSNYKDTLKNVDVRERLVQLAMNNPNYEVSDRLTYIALYQLRLAKGSWLSALSAQGNMNEFTVNELVGAGNATTSSFVNFYPKYNLGLTISFDLFNRNSNNVKIARQNLYIAQAQKNERFREIKADVLTKYEDYLLIKQKLELQSQITTDAYTNYQIAERDYRLNVIKAEELSKTYKNWVAEQVAKLSIQRDLNVSKIDLEKVIGVKFEDLFREN
ncbi:MAG: TolC family protein [Bacteroidetes bacterium]|nr:TolC family protein [Bacteroidota bacterium]